MLAIPPEHPIASSYWAQCGELLAGPHPCVGDRATQRASLRALAHAGIRTIVDLTTAGERPGVRVLWDKLAEDDSECAWVGSPVLNGGIPSRAGMQLVLDTIDASRARGRPVYVHCMGGLGRTGTVVACWWIRHGIVEGEHVFDALTTRRAGQPNAHSISPETAPQFRFIRAWSRGD
ncbi:MAG: dual specificity protein phosphatase family protein [Nannocystaceae bacterium]|nr:dual specificity protein phosphatase family protein [Nannocystaceae bacterium]